MSSKANWKYIAEVIALISVVASLIFVGYELRLSRSIATLEGFGGSGDRAMELKALLADNAEIWEKGCLGEELTSTEYVIFVNLVGAASTRHFTTWNRAQTGITSSNPDLFAMEQAISVYRYPGFRDAWFEAESNGAGPVLRGEFGPWIQAVERQVEVLEQSNYPKEASVAFCGR